MSGGACLSALSLPVLVIWDCEASAQSSAALRRPCLRSRRGPPPPCAATLTTGPRISAPADDDSSRDGGRDGGGRVGRSERQQRQQLLSGKVGRPGTPWLRRTASSCLLAVCLPLVLLISRYTSHRYVWVWPRAKAFTLWWVVRLVLSLHHQEQFVLSSAGGLCNTAVSATYYRSCQSETACRKWRSRRCWRP